MWKRTALTFNLFGEAPTWVRIRIRQLVKKLILINRSPCSMSSKDEEGFDGRKVAAISISVKQALTILDEN